LGHNRRVYDTSEVISPKIIKDYWVDKGKTVGNKLKSVYKNVMNEIKYPSNVNVSNVLNGKP